MVYLKYEITIPKKFTNYFPRLCFKDLSFRISSFKIIIYRDFIIWDWIF